MFKYNELSDLYDGTLVTPIEKMEDGTIRCIDANGIECFYEFEDFDFDTLPEERENQQTPDPVDPPEPPEPEPEKDDADYDGTDIPNDDIIIPEEPEEEERERWMTKDEAEKLARSVDLPVKNGKIRGYKYII